MSILYDLYKSSEPALIQAFAASKFRPEVDPITHSDMIATGGEMYTSRVKLTFTTKTGGYMKYYMYIPGSLLSEQKYLSEQDHTVIDLWLNSIDLVKASLK